MGHFGLGASTGTDPDGAADGEHGDAVGGRRRGGTHTRVTAAGPGGRPDGPRGGALREGAGDRPYGKRRATLRRAGASQTAAVRSGRFLRRGGRAGEGAR
ncbi:DUF6380 family protein [Streptomyces sp. MN13]